MPPEEAPAATAEVTPDGTATAVIEAPATDAPKESPATDDEKPLGPEGEKALREFKKRAREAEAELNRLREQAMTESEKAVAKARKEAADAAKKESDDAWRRRFLRAEIKAAAADKLRDPEDALRYLDVDAFDIAEDGSVDTKAIGRAIDKLLTERDYLRRGKFAGPADAGPRQTAVATDTAPGLPRLTAAYRETHRS